jgi:uncharacterized protein (DUF433 family)
VNEQQLSQRIALNPQVMMGKPVIRGTRLTVEYILNLLAHGATIEEILEEYEGLAQEDVQACLLFAPRQQRGERVDSLAPCAVESQERYLLLTVICFRPFSAAVLGNVTVNTPLSKAASALSVSTVPGSGMVRWKEP